MRIGARKIGTTPHLDCCGETVFELHKMCFMHIESTRLFEIERWSTGTVATISPGANSAPFVRLYEIPRFSSLSNSTVFFIIEILLHMIENLGISVDDKYALKSGMLNGNGDYTAYEATS